MEACLATGMVKLQQAIDDFKKDITEKAEDEACMQEKVWLEKTSRRSRKT